MNINGKLLEAGIPLFFSLIAAILFFRWPFLQFNKEMLQAISALSAMFVGFSGTILALLTALNSELLNKLRVSNYLQHITSLILENVVSSVFSAIVSIIALSISFGNFLNSLLVALLMHCLISFVRNIVVVFLLINTDPNTL
ncbi:hypothetical protein [Neisseria dentiae]|uniref:hypothetical protein n=1 Tax=Neisseria dentiae TaxID=194197 RepID=UPI0035A19860